MHKGTHQLSEVPRVDRLSQTDAQGPRALDSMIRTPDADTFRTVRVLREVGAKAQPLRAPSAEV